MIFKGTDIEDRLHRLRGRQHMEDRILTEVRELLQREDQKEKRIQRTLGSKPTDAANPFDFELLETDRIYHLDQIKKICIDYRLRFLDSSHFKGRIPPGALAEVKALESAHQMEIQGYKIMAPSRLFKLENRDDPLLFAPIGNDYFYLVHKWGKDLHALRKLMVWPFKSLANLVLLVVGLSYLLALMVPEGLFSKERSTAEFAIIFFFLFKCLGAVVIFYGFALGKNFNPAIWNSKYYNS